MCVGKTCCSSILKTIEKIYRNVTWHKLKAVLIHLQIIGAKACKCFAEIRCVLYFWTKRKLILLTATVFGCSLWQHLVIFATDILFTRPLNTQDFATCEYIDWHRSFVYYASHTFESAI